MGLMLVGWLVVAGFTAAIASAKGRNGAGWFVLGLLFSLVALIAAAAMPSLKPAPVARPVGAEAEAEKKCPRCAETVKAAAKICRFCSYEFASPEEQALTARAQCQGALRVGDRVMHAQLGRGEIDEVGVNGVVVAVFNGATYHLQAEELTAAE